jgi:sugar phosphate isomerase/epimerase
MRLGIFAKTFARPTLAETLDAVAAHDLFAIQLNLQSAGVEPMPAAISQDLIDEIRRETERRGIEISSLSGTFNMIHPDPAVVATGLARLDVLAGSARAMGVDLITLCTGSRNTENMWHRHSDNDSEAAWTDLLESMTRALEIAERGDVRLGVEPEPGNVINSAEKCRKLLDYFNSPRIGVVFDPANLVSTNLTRDPE